MVRKLVALDAILENIKIEGQRRAPTGSCEDSGRMWSSDLLVSGYFYIVQCYWVPPEALSKWGIVINIYHITN